MGERSEQQFNRVRHLTDIDNLNVTNVYARLIVDKYEQYKTRFVSLDNPIERSNCIPPNLGSMSSQSFARLC